MDLLGKYFSVGLIHIWLFSEYLGQGAVCVCVCVCMCVCVCVCVMRMFSVALM